MELKDVIQKGKDSVEQVAVDAWKAGWESALEIANQACLRIQAKAQSEQGKAAAGACAKAVSSVQKETT